MFGRPGTILLRSAVGIAALVVISPLAASIAAHPTQLMRQDRAHLTESAIAATPLVRGETVRAAVALQVESGLHVNANPPTYDYLIPVEISITGPAGVELGTAFYPEAAHEKFPYAEEPLAVYEGTVVIGTELSVTPEAPLGERNLEISVRYQACNDRACFAPATTKLTLPITVAPEGTVAERVDSPLLSQAPFPGS